MKHDDAVKHVRRLNARVFAARFPEELGRADRQLQYCAVSPGRLRASADRRRARRRSNQLDSWIAIAADGSVTAYTGKGELGQGISTAQTQLVAEELCVPFDRVS